MLPPSLLKGVPPKRNDYSLLYGLSAKILGLQKPPTYPEFPIPDPWGGLNGFRVDPMTALWGKPDAHYGRNKKRIERTKRFRKKRDYWRPTVISP